MGIADDAVEIRARGWRTMAALHAMIEAELERALSAEAGLSVVEYGAGGAEPPGRLAYAHAAARPRRRPEPERDHAPGEPSRGPRAADPDPVPRRSSGIYTELTPSGQELYERARPCTTRPWSASSRMPPSSRSCCRWSTRCTTSPAPAEPPSAEACG